MNIKKTLSYYSTKYLLTGITCLFCLGILFSCVASSSSDDDLVPETINVTGMLQGTHNWTSDNIYVLNQKVVVDADAILNIEAGTIIKGSAGEGSLSSALIVARGGKIYANGTADAPIIMTSISDDIKVGQTFGTNLSATDQGLWGGLIVLGNAPCSFSGDVSEEQIEGIPTDDTYGLYGGSDATDNSGVISYVSIRHGGTSEFKGLSLGGVGNGTTISNVEVIASADDGIEFMGGTVDASNLLVWAQGDDGFDIDQAYSGTISNSMVILGENSDHALEIDGPEGSMEDQFTLNNITLVGYFDAEGGEYADYRSNAMGASNNVAAYNFFAGKDVELDNDGVATNYNDGLLTFGTWQIEVPDGDSLEEIFNNKADNVTVTGFGSTASNVAANLQTVGADASVFSWTMAAAEGATGL